MIRYQSLAAASVSLFFSAAPSLAATVATFEAGASWSINLTSAVSKTDGTDVTDEIVDAPVPFGENEIGAFYEIEDGPSGGGSGSLGSGSIGDENTGARLVSNGVAGSDATPDGKYVRAGRGFEQVSGFGYRSECDFDTCSDDPGVNLTFSYNYEGYASTEVPDLIASHQASASVRPIISFQVGNFFGVGDFTTLLEYNEPILISSAGTNLVQEETDIFSGTFLVSLAPGTAFSSFANVNYNGRVNLAPAPVPLPASGLMLLAGFLFSLLLRRKRIFN